ncbi:ADP-dependent glucokinase isoform X2 [Nerophis ophidion]|uniref:ADP-dependent glucokinase isoform X2 n=1 Tax=Nerophis ophidion TaxID=159077 RepID=UPI002AE053D7|nr:ADP-dependent glucokinase isoform X2 [Nerophis ophidion]
MEGGGRASWVKYGPLVSLFVLFLAIWYRSPDRGVLDDRLDTVLSSLLRAERKVGINDVARPKVAIGFGGCVDLIVDAVSLLSKIGITPADQPLHHDVIDSAEQLSQSFAYFFAPGAAAEYIVHSDDHNPYLASMEEFAKKLQDFDPDLLVVGGLQMMDNFPFQSGERGALLSRLAEVLVSSSPTIGVHFEMASFVEESIMEDLLYYVIPHADSLGMNEQELPNLLSLLKGSNITVLSDPNPRVATVLDQMREVYRLVNQRYKDASAQADDAHAWSKPLTRLHVHTLAFQAMIVTRGSQWKNTMSATAKASLTANRHVCGSNDIDPSKARLIMDDSFSVSRREGSQRIALQESRPVSCWEEDDYEICVAPVLVCTEVYQTAGGGDNISAAGLVLQI